MKNPDTLIERLCSYRKRDQSIFNPWAESCAFDRSKSERLRRQERLIQHLSVPNPQFILLGEAAGYQGCRYSGVTFTSEKILLNTGIPRVAKLTERITTPILPFCEPSATIVWGALRKNSIADQVILWNTYPFHPMKPSGIHTNRTPSRAEIDDGSQILSELLSLYKTPPKIVAVGQKAFTLLSKIGIVPFASVRHPAFGGANEFRSGIETMLCKKS